MPGEYGQMKSVSIYIEKDYVEKAEILASKNGKKRSTIMAEILRAGLSNVF